MTRVHRLTGRGEGAVSSYVELMTDKTQQGAVRYDVKAGVAFIEFFHPAQNSLPAKLLTQLVAAIQRAGEDEAAGIVVLRSEGERTFCAGASFDELAAIPRTRLVLTSGLYRNPPFGEIPQPDYVNAAGGLLTRLAPLELLDELKRIETAHGRDRNGTAHWGPRTLDLDLLVFGDRELGEPRLTLPHPGIRGRNFVLFPLLDIAPGLYIPGMGSVRELAATVDGSTLQPVG